MSVLRIGLLAGFMVVSAVAQEYPDTTYQAAVDLLSVGQQARGQNAFSFLKNQPVIH